MLAYLLRQQGHRVVLATDGSAALPRFRAATPDLVLLDLQLPYVSGFDVCRAIRLVAQTPIVCLSAFTDAETRRTAYALGADDYVLKPFSFALFTARMRALLRPLSTPDGGRPGPGADAR